MKNRLLLDYQQIGAKVVFNLTGHLPYMQNIGPVETLEHADGRTSKIILPQMPYKYKSKTRFVNLPWPEEEYKRKALGILPAKEFSFMSQMPPVCEECLNGPKYNISDGLRKYF